jgi:hypothetical protein
MLNIQQSQRQSMIYPPRLFHHQLDVFSYV